MPSFKMMDITEGVTEKASKKPYILFSKDQRARVWAAIFALLGAQLKEAAGIHCTKALISFTKFTICQGTAVFESSIST